MGTNIGVFVCIRCSGVHRNMGTHISKVKSATLDIWKMDLVKHFMAQGGNEAVNAKYEATLDPAAKPRPSTDMYILQRFIEDKYKRKKWYSKKTKKGKKKKSVKKPAKESSSESSDESSSSSTDEEV